LGTLALRTKVAVGNDTGPMHLISLSGTPSVALFGSDSDPSLCAPRGDKVCILAAPEISAHSATDVKAALAKLAGIT